MFTVQDTVSSLYGERLLLTVKEVAGPLVPLSASHLYELMDQGSFPEVRAGRSRLVPVHGLAAWIEGGGTDRGNAQRDVSERQADAGVETLESTRSRIRKSASSSNWRKDLAVPTSGGCAA